MDVDDGPEGANAMSRSPHFQVTGWLWGVAGRQIVMLKLEATPRHVAPLCTLRSLALDLGKLRTGLRPQSRATPRQVQRSGKYPREKIMIDRSVQRTRGS